MIFNVLFNPKLSVIFFSLYVYLSSGLDNVIRCSLLVSHSNLD